MSKILDESIQSCADYDRGIGPSRRTTCIYPFTTENIGGYIDIFDLKDKSLLTVGSSGDQAINAALYGCKDITLLDVVPDTRYYYYLKVAALLSLSREEYIDFFSYHFSSDNSETFDLTTYRKLRDTLKVLDEESFNYFDTLFSRFIGIVIRKSIFQTDEHIPDIVVKSNPYLSSDISYDETKERIKNVNTEFLCQDVLNIDVNKSYDNIWLSNIATWLDKKNIIKMANSTYPLLNDSGKLLLSYLYHLGINTKFDPEREPIYNIELMKKLFKKYNIELKEFESVSTHYKKDLKDSILTLTK
ncbi:MAG: DUF3419 family protein [Bacilli bacterium]|nr:DUF3419 family protein [Bacilli bacterium]